LFIALRGGRSKYSAPADLARFLHQSKIFVGDPTEENIAIKQSVSFIAMGVLKMKMPEEFSYRLLKIGRFLTAAQLLIEP
jgi:hypothetical protein